MKKWTKEQINYLKKISDGKFDQEIADLINKKFGTNYTKYAINSQKRKYHIRSTADWKTKYTQEVIDFMIKNYQGKDNIELANLLKEKFGIDTNGDKVCMLKANLIRRYGINLRTGINKGCYKKGNVPVNKGTKGMFNVGGNKTSFKKGHRSANAVPIGTEHKRYSKGDEVGYWCVKVCDGKGNKNWVAKHRLIYEKAYGKIPKGHKVIFADGNRENFDLDNLVLVSSSEELILNRRKLLFDDKEITKTGVLIAKVIDKTNKVKNERL